MLPTAQISGREKCLYCNRLIPDINDTTAGKSRAFENMPGILVTKDTPAWERAQKVVGENEKCTFYQDGYAGDFWWVLLLDMPHGSPEEKRIFDWVKTGRSPETV